MRRLQLRAWLREQLGPYPLLQTFLVPDILDPYAQPVGRPVPGQRIKLDFGPHQGSILATAIGFSWPLLGIQYALDEPYEKAVPRLTGRLKIKPVYERVIAAQNVAVLKPADGNTDRQLPVAYRYPDSTHWRLFTNVPGQKCYRCSSREVVRLKGRRNAPAICRACNSDQTPREQWTEGRYVEIPEYDLAMRTDG